MKKFLCWMLILAMALGTCGAMADGTVILKKKSSGNAVKLLQKELRSLGYFSGKLDGKYGDDTVYAVRRFRVYHNLADGENVDNNTVWAIYTEQGRPTLGQGSTGMAVYAAQWVLWSCGYLTSNPSGKFDKATQKAAAAYQKANKGAAADYYRRKMAYLAAQAAQATPTPQPQFQATTDDMPVVMDEPVATPVPSAQVNVNTDGIIYSNWLEFMLSGTVPYSRVLKKGNKGNDVKRMQTRLKKLKYLATRADGLFGTGTVRALKYFQYRNGLPQTGVLDAATQKALYSDGARKSNEYVSAYKAYVSRKKNKVWIYKWTGKGYDKLAKTFVCTTGAKGTPTIKGTFQAVGQAGVRWWKMPDCWVQYCFIINGGYFFHSLLYNKKGAARPTYGSVYNLGKNASHGCVRLELKNAKWIYYHCEPGMTVVIK